MNRASRQILTALSSISHVTLPPRTGAQPMGAVGARVVGGFLLQRLLRGLLFRPWETARATLLDPRELCGRVAW